MKLTPDQLAEAIRRTRTALGVTQERLAMTAGTGLRFIVDLEKGKPTCQLGKTLAVLNTLGINLTLTAPVDDAKGDASRGRTREAA
jgi:HTH-type transcriptional regulator / antitoxin HipB